MLLGIARSSRRGERARRDPATTGSLRGRGDNRIGFPRSQGVWEGGLRQYRLPERVEAARGGEGSSNRSPSPVEEYPRHPASWFYREFGGDFSTRRGVPRQDTGCVIILRFSSFSKWELELRWIRLLYLVRVCRLEIWRLPQARQDGSRFGRCYALHLGTLCTLLGGLLTGGVRPTDRIRI